MDVKGKIYNIMKYSIHDGPGIRTTVFLKGCPLQCWWCHNPESQEMEEELILFPNRCICCGACINTCRQDAIKKVDERIITNRSMCNNCGLCVEECYTNAREIAGRSVTVDEVISEILKDKDFYQQSGGGVTISGGEPLMQMEFLIPLLERLRELGIHRAIDTCGYVSKEKLQRVIELTDLFLYDLKFMDSERHEKYTGVPNDLILENVKLLSSLDKDIIIRIPIIPGVNDDKEDILAFSKFINDLPKVKGVNLLPYHKIGKEKYHRLGKVYKMTNLQEPTHELMSRVYEMLKNCCSSIKIGG